MSRKIKFRAWNIKTKTMIDLHKITPLALSESMNSQLALQGMDGLFIPFHEKLILEQFTGLHDKNGKEIYEGDIVKLKHGMCGTEHIGIISWGVEKAGYYAREPEMKQFGWSLDTQFIEVIGNIHENGDLLNDTDEQTHTS